MEMEKLEELIALQESRADELSMADLDELALNEFRELRETAYGLYRLLPENDSRQAKELRRRLDGVIVRLVCTREHWGQMNCGSAA